MKIIFIYIIQFFLMLTLLYGDDISLSKAKELYEKGNYKKSIEILNNLLKKDSSLKSQIYNLRGINNYHLGKYKEALEDFHKSLFNAQFLLNTIIELNKKEDIKELNQFITNVHFNRTLVYQELGLLDSTLIDLNYVIENDKNNKFAYFNKGFVYYQMGNKDSAIEYFSKVLLLDSNDLDAKYNRANIYYELQNCNKAREDYVELIDKKKYDEYIYLNIGNCYFNDKEYQLSIDYYTKALELNNLLIVALYNRAQAYKSINELEKATLDLQIVLKNIEKDKKMLEKKELITKELEYLIKLIENK